ncbi:tape measure protein [Mucilaginibacter gossypii]|uniref:tape measure protein n=1 Tax=Mucilaginibacter gossypii TaxID=551996 RepID=UPI000DCDC364|nr:MULTISPECIES: tape measure protein [Mucilaginibacter]QTE36030.1 tape measure protein [Mucilaginibacter gossypii]RAV56704.1 hypothetical protein DIU36_14985 [Mucilaginibacter rubeus]
MDGLGPIDIDILINNPALLRSLRQAEQDTQNTNRVITREGQQMSEALDGWAKKATIAATSFFSIQAAQNFVQEIIKVRGEFEQLNVAYDTILKSKAKGDALFAETVKFAATTPFNLTDVATATKQLLAYGFAAKDITDVLTTTGNIAAGVSVPLGDIVYLYGTLKTQGRAYAQDIRQFTGRGIPIIQELAKQFHVGEEEVNKLVEAGKVGFPEVQKAFESLTGSSGIFYNLMEKQSHTLTGMLSNLEDAFSQMLNSIGESNEGILKGGIELAASLVTNYQKVIDIVELLIITYGAYRAALLLQTASTIASTIASGANTVAIGLETVAYRLLRDGLEVLNAEKILTIATTAAYTAVISALVIALKSWHDASDLTNRINSETNAITSDANVQVEVQKTKINDLNKIINDHNNTQEDRLAALKKLNAIAPEYLGNITLETANTKAASKAIKDYLDDLDKKLQGEAAYSQKLENLKKITELKTKGIDAISSTERVGYSLKNFFSGNFTTSTDADNKQIVAQLVKTYEDANKQIDAQFGDQIKKTLTGNTGAKDFASKFGKDLKAALAGDGVKGILDNFNTILKEANSETDLEALRDGLSAKLKALAPNDSQKAALKKRLAEVKDLIKTYDPGEDVKLQKAANAEIDARNTIAEKVAAINEDSRQNALTNDQKEIAQAKQKYDQLLKMIDDYNVKAERNKWKKIDPAKFKVNGIVTDIPAAEQAAVADVIAKQQVEKQRIVIDQQKEIFDAFEQYKIDHGEAAANQLYSGQLQGFKTYVEYLKSLMPETGDLSAKANAQRDMLSKLIVTANKEDQKAQLTNFAQLLASTLTYEQQRNAIVQKYLLQASELRKHGLDTQASQAIANGQEELTQLDNSNTEKLTSYKELFDGLHKISVERSQQDIKQLNAYADSQFKAGLMTEEAYLKLKKEIHEASAEIANMNADKLLAVGSALESLSGSLGGISSGLGDLVGGLAKTVNSVAGIGKLKTAFDSAQGSQAKFIAGANFYGAAISSAANLVGIFTSAAKQRKEAEEAYQNSVLAFQNQYKINTIEQIRLQEQLNGNLFFKNYQKDIANAASSLATANRAFQTSLGALQNGQAKVGQRNAVDWNNVLKGAGAGAALGSIIPGIGNAVGAVVGGVVGAIGGLFGGKKKKDVYGSLLGEYPELITKAKDGTDQFNAALAKNLIQNNLVNDSTKVLLQNTIDLNDARQAAIDQINQDIKDLAGNLGTDLQNSLVAAFENGTDAFQSFKGTVEKGIQDIVAQFLFENIFGGEFDKLSDELKASFSVTGDQNAVDDITKFYQDAGPLVKQYQDALKAAQAEAKKNGLDLFKPDGSGSSSSSSLSGAISGITADQANVLEGAIRGMQQTLLEISNFISGGFKSMADWLLELKGQTLLQKQIEANTRRTADNTDKMVSSLDNIDNNTSSASLTNVFRAAGKS